MLIRNLNLEHVLFLDIETVPCVSDYQLLAEPMKKLWNDRAARIKAPDQPADPDELFSRAGLFAEFGKIICISVGFLAGSQFRIKSFYGHNEAEILAEFCNLLNRYYNQPHHMLCAHNGKEFDFPYLSRRIIIQGMELPDILNLNGKKPWENQFLDTLDLWRFGDFKSYTSLALLTTVLGIPSPKDDMDGSMVAEVYWKQNDLPRIVTYCQKDTLATAQVLLRLQGLPLIEESAVVIV